MPFSLETKMIEARTGCTVQASPRITMDEDDFHRSTYYTIKGHHIILDRARRKYLSHPQYMMRMNDGDLHVSWSAESVAEDVAKALGDDCEPLTPERSERFRQLRKVESEIQDVGPVWDLIKDRMYQISHLFEREGLLTVYQEFLGYDQWGEKEYRELCKSVWLVLDNGEPHRSLHHAMQALDWVSSVCDPYNDLIPLARALVCFEQALR